MWRTSRSTRTQQRVGWLFEWRPAGPDSGCQDGEPLLADTGRGRPTQPGYKRGVGGEWRCRQRCVRRRERRLTVVRRECALSVSAPTGSWGAKETSPKPVPRDHSSVAVPRFVGRLFKRVRRFVGSAARPNPLPGREVLRGTGQQLDLQGLCSRAARLHDTPDGNEEVLCGAGLDNKIPDFRGFFSYQSPLTDSNRRPPPYHRGFGRASGSQEIGSLPRRSCIYDVFSAVFTFLEAP